MLYLEIPARLSIQGKGFPVVRHVLAKFLVETASQTLVQRTIVLLVCISKASRF